MQIFHIKVPIKKELMKGVVMGLGSKLAIGKFLSFVGYRHVRDEFLCTVFLDPNKILGIAGCHKNI